MNTFSIDLKNNTEGSLKVTYESINNAKDEPEWFYVIDLVLFTCFALRTFSNNKNHPGSLALANALERWQPPLSLYKTIVGNRIEIDSKIMAWPNHILLDAASSMGLSFEEAKKKYNESLWLINYQGDGKRRFIGNLGVGSISKSWKFVLNYKGFSFFGNDLPLLTNDAVLIYLCYLANKHKSNPNRIDAIKLLARHCAIVFRNNQITMQNQEKIAWNLVKEYS